MAANSRLTVLCGHALSPSALAFSPDGRLLASGDPAGWVYLWDLTGRAGARVLRRPDLRRRRPWVEPASRRPGDPRPPGGRAADPPPGVTQLAFLPEGARLAVTVEFDGVEIWALASGTRERVLPLEEPIATDGDAPWGLEPGVRGVRAERDGLVAAGEGSGVIRLSGPNGAAALPTTEASVVSVAFNPDGEGLVSAHADGVVRCWSLRTGARTRHVRSPWGALVTLHPDASVALATDGRVAWVWDVATGAVRLRVSAAGVRQWALGGRTLVAARGPGGVTAWDLATGVPRCHRAADATWIALDREGERIATATRASEPRLAVCSLATGRTLDLPEAPEARSLAFSPDGRTLVLGGAGFTVGAWDLGTARRVGQWTPPADAVTVAVSVDGRMAGATDYDPAIWLHDPATSTSRVLLGHRGPARAVAFSPDGRWLASGATDGAVCLWDPRTGARVVTWQVLPSADGWVAHTPRDAWIGSPDAPAFLRRGAGVIADALPPPAPPAVARALAAPSRP